MNHKAAAAWAAAMLAVAGPGLAQTPPAGDPAAGAAVIGQSCATCHGPTGRGATGPSIVGNTWRHGETDAELAASIRHGYPGLGMPAWDGTLSDRQIADVIAFIRKNPMLGQAAGAAAIPADPLPTGVVRTAVESYRLERVAKVEQPYGLAFLPDGRLLVTEIAGRLRIVEHGRLLPQPVIGTPSGATPQDASRRRLMDVGVPPDYGRTGWIYLTWGDQAPGVSGAKGVRLVLSRGRLRAGRWVDNQELFRAPSDYSSAGRIAFDGDGHVFLSVQDPEFLENPIEAPAPAQDLANPKGKILRFNADGSAPADNPFPKGAGAARFVWSLGHRTQMGLAFDRRGRLWEVENGPRGGDELNLIQRGRNYGWPTITWGHRSDDKAVSAPSDESGTEQPVVNWSPSPALSGLAIYQGRGFPHWRGDLFISSMKNRSLMRVVLDGRDRPVLQEIVLNNVARMRDVEAGPDGALYLITEDNDLLRLRPAGK